MEGLRIVVAGHVDHGKSTLIGRLAHSLKRIEDGKEEAIRAACQRRGVAFEWAFLLDALQLERDQGITVDTSPLSLTIGERRVMLVDAPGHREFLRNMITGAWSADAALLVVDAREGAREQSRKHAGLLQLLGIKQLAVAVNKMDTVEYGEAAFRTVEQEFGDYLRQLGFNAAPFIPVSARDGEGLAGASTRMPWHTGLSVVDAIEKFQPMPPQAGPLRLWVQDVYRQDDRRIVVGRVESGRLRVGDRLLFSPSGAEARVKSIEGEQEAEAGKSIGITLDTPVFVERGQRLSHADSAPLLSHRFPARIFWLARLPLTPGARLRLRFGTLEVAAEAESVKDSDEAVFRTRGPVPLDEGARFAILQDGAIVGGGVAALHGVADERIALHKPRSAYIAAVAPSIDASERARANGHLPGIFWFTGLSGAGKSTLAQAAQKRLFARGAQVVVLDGDELRAGLSRDLAFSPEDRTEHLRRAAEVAALFAGAGFIVLAAFISPLEKDRAAARAIGGDYFYDVYIKADIATCEARDAKGLYRKARTEVIADFTGVSAPYEEPRAADLIIGTAGAEVEACAAQLVRFIERQCFETEAEVDFGAGI